MKAIVQDVYGSADVLELRDIDKPVAGDDDVLVRVRAAGRRSGRLAPHDGPAVPGAPHGLRSAQAQVRVRGLDVAGRVEAVGENVTRFQAGRRGVRHLRRLLRRVRVRPGGQARAEARRTSPSSRRRPSPSPPSPPCRRCATRAGFSRGRRSWSSARREAWGRSRCSWPRCSARTSPACAAPTKVGPGPLARGGRRHRLHPRGLRGRRPPLRPHPRHRGQPPAVPPPACAHPAGNARHRRRRRRRTVVRRCTEP